MLVDLRPTLPLATRIRYGAAMALTILGLPVLLLAGLALVRGRYLTPDRVEIDLWLGALVYPLAIATAGAIAGAGLPFARSAGRAALLGAAAGLPAFLLLGLMFAPHALDRWTRWLIVSVPLGLAFGSMLGASLYAIEAGGAERRARRRARRRAKRGTT